MRVTIKPRLSVRHPGTVYADIVSDETGQPPELLVSATLDYCLSASENRNYTIVNAQELLFWLHKNAEFNGYTTA